MFKSITITLLCLIGSLTLHAADTWAFEPETDTFSEEALLDLRYLNEKHAGQSGWVRTNGRGDFVRGDGKDIRFWALNTGVEKDPAHERPLWNHMSKVDLAWHAKFLAKRGVNMVRLGTELNPDPKTQNLNDVNMNKCQWAWKAIGAMAKEGIYSTFSPYWAFLVKSDDKKWGTDWNGKHAGLLFFDERLQAAYKNWLKTFFTTPSEHLGGKTLAEFPGLAVFQIQNEDSLLFWTVNRIEGPAARKLGKLFGEWTIKKYGTLDKAYAVWGKNFSEKDDRANGVCMMANLWHMSKDGRKDPRDSQRINDQLQFWTELMRNFNDEIARYIHDDLKCPVLINGGNWKSGDSLLLNDAERYSYTANEVIAVNRYFGGLHNGEHRGWAILNGDEYTNKSVVDDAALEFPLNLKQVAGKPMIITESIWVFPEENAFQGSLLISAYSSLNGLDGLYWNGAYENDWAHPKAANGYKPSQKKWICMTPDQSGQWPGAALMLRKGYIKRGQPVVHEHRSLEAIYSGKTPIISESATFDPNRDAGDLPANSAVKTGVSPWAYFAGPVHVTYDSDESKTTVANIDQFISKSGNGMRVESCTGELILDTGKKLFTVDTPQCQAMTGHFSSKSTVDLSDVSITTSNSDLSISIISMDEKALKTSAKILVQIGNKCRPTDWATEPVTITPKNAKPLQGFKVTNYGKRPWQIVNTQGSISIANTTIKQVHTLDANGVARESKGVQQANGKSSFAIPSDTLYLVLTP